jgi:transcriptional regulator with XRE-family HTH domain
MTYLTIDAIAAQLRAEMECSQREMAKRIGVAQPTVAQALQGESRQIETLRKIAEEMDCTIGKEPHYRFTHTSSNS